MHDKYKISFTLLALTIITLVVFWQVHSFDFVNYDDDVYVSSNQHIYTGFTVDNIKWLFTKDIGRWHPLTGLTHMLDCKLFGLNPGRHHLTNLLLHIANTLLLFFVFRRATGAPWRSVFVAALFAIHPQHVESVAWISGRKDLLSTLFWILTIGAYLCYVEKRHLVWYATALALFALGLMAKPMVVTLPFVLLLLDYWPLQRFQVKIPLRLIWEKVPFLIIAGLASIFTFFLFKGVGQVQSIEALPLTFRVNNALIAYVRYIGKTIWPAGLAANYPYSENIVPFWQVIIAALLLLTITVWVILLGRRYKYLPVGWFMFLVTLLPVIQLVQISLHAMADRYTYLSLTGLFIIIAWGAGDLLSGWRYKRIVFGFASAAIICVLSVCAWLQTGYWHDSIRLFEHAIKVTKENFIAYTNLGTAYNGEGQYDIAISDFNKALEIYPTYALAYNNRGGAYNAKGKFDLAIRDYNKAIEINPGYAEAYYNRGTVYCHLGEYERGVSDYNKAIEINPELVDVYNNRGNAYKEKGQLELAISDYNKAIRISPMLFEAYEGRGGVWDSKGELDRAIADYSKAIELNPKSAKAYYNRGTVYCRKGEYALAVGDFDKALEINPVYAEACFNKARTCEYAGRDKEASDAYRAFIQCAPANYNSQIEYAKQRIRLLGR